MNGSRVRQVLVVTLFFALVSFLYDSTHVDAQASTDQITGQFTGVPQPTPPLTEEDNPLPAAQALARRPYPTIIGRVIAPSPRKPLPVTVAPATNATVPPVVWEAPIGPAANWQGTDNFLVLGTDRRAGEGSWRTDVIMIVGIDRAQGQAAVFSIPRDLYVQIPGYGYGRINQADFLGERNGGYGGGPKLISSILSATLGIETNHWVRIQMDGFVQVVDAIGGVNVYLDCPFYEPIFNLTTQSWDYFTLPAGDNFLDGEDAYWFVRLRLRESDIGRSARQRQFLWALRDKMLNTNMVTRFPELWSAFQDTFSTDLSLFELVDLTRLGLSFNAENVHAGGLTLADLQGFTTEQGAAVLRIANPGRVRAVVNGVWEAPAMAATNRRAPEQCPPLPQGAVPIVTDAGVQTVPAPNASTPVSQTTTGGG